MLFFVIVYFSYREAFMKLNQLKQSISNKQKVESKIKELEIEKAKFQRECSILSQELDEENTKLNKLENPFLSLFPNHDNKILEQQEIVRKIKRKYNSVKYNLDLIIIDLNKQTQYLQEIICDEKIYEQELEKQISLLKNEEYEQIKKDNQHYHTVLDEGLKIIECLKKMDLYYTRGDNYPTIDKRFTLGNTTWIMGSPSVDIHNLKKEIHLFETPLSQINHADLNDDIQLYFEYSNQFFNNILDIIEIVFTRNNDYAIRIIDFKRDVSNILNRIRIVFENNLVREKELKKQLEEAILKAEL